MRIGRIRLDGQFRLDERRLRNLVESIETLLAFRNLNQPAWRELTREIALTAGLAWGFATRPLEAVGGANDFNCDPGVGGPLVDAAELVGVFELRAQHLLDHPIRVFFVWSLRVHRVPVLTHPPRRLLA